MKFILLAALAASLSFAQNAKVEPPKADVTASAVPTERSLTNEEAQAVQISMLKIHLLNDQYQIEKYQAAVKPWTEKQQALRDTLCKSVGTPADKINTTNECVLTGFGNDGDPISGPDGRPMPQKVIWQKPAEKK